MAQCTFLLLRRPNCACISGLWITGTNWGIIYTAVEIQCRNKILPVAIFFMHNNISSLTWWLFISWMIRSYIAHFQKKFLQYDISTEVINPFMTLVIEHLNISNSHKLTHIHNTMANSNNFLVLIYKFIFKQHMERVVFVNLRVVA